VPPQRGDTPLIVLDGLVDVRAVIYVHPEPWLPYNSTSRLVAAARLRFYVSRPLTASRASAVHDRLPAMITVITGPRGSGKTTLCRRLAEQARASGCDVAGILSPAVFDGDEKVGIEAVDLRTGERRLLARRRSADDADGGLRTPGWVFEETTVTWGNAVLAAATPCDLLVIDELGPLELERGEGWTAAFAAIDDGRYREALVVVRLELLGLAQARWPNARVTEVGD
jgi:nucleoside-triphosphatase THEP1